MTPAIRNATIVALLWAAHALAGEVKLPAEVKVKVGRLLKVEATNSDAGKVVRWINTNEDVDLIESETGKHATVLATKAGRYKIAAYSDAGGPPAYCVINSEPDAPVPPPLPPLPPQSDLAKAFQAAYNADVSPKKKEYLKFMADFFGNADSLVDGSDTVVSLFTKVSAGLRAAGVGIPKPDFQGCVDIAAKHFANNIGMSGTLDKPKAKAAFASISNALKTVAP